jgi:hypothetical protein
MLIDLLKISALMAALIVPLFFPVTKINAVRIPKNYNDTSDAHYAINERGCLEEIRHDNISSHEVN